jgi:hypothetical protein
VILYITLATAVLIAIWFKRNPRCPACGARKWNRQLCRPLLFCRRCAQRSDLAGRRA